MLLGKLRDYLLEPKVRGLKNFLADGNQDHAKIQEYQLEQLNIVWQEAISQTQYYRKLSEGLGCPKSFNNIEQFINCIPILTRRDVKAFMHQMTNQSRDADFFRVTGGSTAEPICLPAWSEEEDCSAIDLWTAREEYMIRPSSKLFLLWGHGHLFGTGPRRSWNTVKRKIADTALNYWRWSAYDLSSAALRKAAEKMIEVQPEYLVGYSVALDLFAKYNVDKEKQLRKIGLKAVIGAAERFPESDSRLRLEKLFNCNVGMEYGSVETRLIAHTVPSGGYRVFWNNFLVEAVRIPEKKNCYKVLVTALKKRAFPLFRYDLGDTINLNPSDESLEHVKCLRSFAAVDGRLNQSVLLSDGSVLHSEVITHAMRNLANHVYSFQLVVYKDRRFELLYLSDSDLPENEVKMVRDFFRKVNSQLGNLSVTRTDQLGKTLAGKTPLILESNTTK
jgi:phenylacetate-coenzyme A ligase PaaK-like adenylate-forming protein